MIGGGGYYPGVMDFGGGIQKGNYRVYPGSYLQAAEKEGRHHRRGELAAHSAHTVANKDTEKKTKEVLSRSSTSSSSTSPKPAWYGRRRRSHRRRHPGDPARPPLNGVWGRNADHLRAFAQQRAKAVLARLDASSSSSSSPPPPPPL